MSTNADGTGEPKPTSETHAGPKGSAANADTAAPDGQDSAGADDLGVIVEVEPPAGQEGGEVSELASGVETSPISELEAQLAEMAAKQADTYERLLRTTADLDNLRKRSRRELDAARYEASGKALLEMLPVIDNLDRAVVHAESSQDVKSIVEGVNLVLRGFGQALERCGVKPITALGAPFDPNVHEAVSQQPSADHAPGTVIAELQKGYLLGERLLRPALVVVSTAAQATAAEPGTESTPDSEPETSGNSDAAPPGELES